MPTELLFSFVEGLARGVDEGLRREPPPAPKQKRGRTAYRPMTEDEQQLAGALGRCSFSVGSFDKRFARDISKAARAPEATITEKQARLLRKLVYRYRRQIPASSVPASERKLLFVSPEPMTPEAVQAAIAEADRATTKPEPDVLALLAAGERATRERANQLAASRAKSAGASPGGATAPAVVTEPKPTVLLGTCKARCRHTGRRCAKPMHSDLPHRSGRYEFTAVAFPGQTHFAGLEESEAHAQRRLGGEE